MLLIDLKGNEKLEHSLKIKDYTTFLNNMITKYNTGHNDENICCSKENTCCNENTCCK